MFVRILPNCDVILRMDSSTEDRETAKRSLAYISPHQCRRTYDFLRKKIVGQKLEVETVDESSVIIKTGDAVVNEALVSAGLAKCLPNAPQQYVALERDAPKEEINEKPVVTHESLTNLVRTKEELDVVIDDVISPTQYLCYFPSLNCQTNIYVTGVKALDGSSEKEAMEFVKHEILQRDLRVRVDGQVPILASKTYCSFYRPSRQLLAEFLIQTACAQVDLISVQLLASSEREVLKSVASVAVQRKLKRDVAPSTKMFGRLADIISSTCLVILESNKQPITLYNEYHVVYLSHLSSRGREWLAAAKECITNVCGSNEFEVQLDYKDMAPIGFLGQTSDDYGNLHNVTITQLRNPNGGPPICLNEALVRAGVVGLYPPRKIRAPGYDAWLALHKASKVKTCPQMVKLNDVTKLPKNAAALFASLSKETNVTLRIDKVLSGTRYRAYIPAYTTLMTVSLAGVTSPLTRLPNADESNKRKYDEPFAQECIKWAQLNLLFNEYRAKFINCSPSGVCSVTLYPTGTSEEQSIQELMLSEGLALVFKRKDERLNQLEDKAIAEEKGIWSTPDNIAYYGRGGQNANAEELLGGWGNVIISHCESVKEVYLQKHSELSSLNDLERLLAGEERKPVTWPPAVGRILMAKYESVWYRARVVQSDENQVTVFYLDYGNKQEIRENDCLAELPPACDVFSYPPMAHRVELAYIKNCSIDNEATEKGCDVIMDFGYEESIDCQCLSFAPLAPYTPQVRLTYAGGLCDLAKELLECGYAKLQTTDNLPRNDKLLNDYREVEAEAREKRLGIWVHGDIGDTDDEF